MVINPHELVKNCLMYFAVSGIFMPLTLRKLKGHIALGLSVRPSIQTLR